MAVLNAFLAIAFLLFINPSCGSPVIGGEALSTASVDQAEKCCEDSAATKEIIYCSEYSKGGASLDVDSNLVSSDYAGQCEELYYADESYGKNYGSSGYLGLNDVGYTASGASERGVSETVLISDDRSNILNQGNDLNAKSDFNCFMISSAWDLAKDFTSCSTSDCGYYIRADKASSNCFNKGEDLSAIAVVDSDQERVCSDSDQYCSFGDQQDRQLYNSNDANYNMYSGCLNNEDASSSYTGLNNAVRQGTTQNCREYASADSSEVCDDRYSSCNFAGASSDYFFEDEEYGYINGFC